MVTCLTTGFADDEWTLTFNSSNVNQLEMGSSTNVNFYVQTSASWHDENLKVRLMISDEDVAYASKKEFDLPQNHKKLPTTWLFSFNLTSEFIGYTKLELQVVESSKRNIVLSERLLFAKLHVPVQFKLSFTVNNTIVPVKNASDGHMNVVVNRKPQLIDTIFIICVAGLMSIIFINFGCALDVEQLKLCARKPIAPVASFVAQFIILPLVSLLFIIN